MCPRRGGLLVHLGLCCELYVEVKGIKVGEELLGVLCLVDDKGVIHIPKPDSGETGCGPDASGFEVLHKQVTY